MPETGNLSQHLLSKKELAALCVTSSFLRFRRESNPHQTLRRRPFYPLNYGNILYEKGYNAYFFGVNTAFPPIYGCSAAGIVTLPSA